MKNYVLVILLSTLSLFFTVKAEVPNWSFPEPEEYALHLVELCKPESSSAIFIAILRDEGLTKEQVSSHLPQGASERLRLTHVVQENLNDLFEYPNVAAISYYAFRAQSCANEKGEGKAPTFTPPHRHSPRQQAFTNPPPPTTDRHSFISNNDELICC